MNVPPDPDAKSPTPADPALSFEQEALGPDVALDDALLEEDTARRYEILEQIGAGATGAVYRARDRRLGRVIALKRIDPAKTRAPEALARLVHEARAIASLNHFNIVQVYDIGRDEHGYFIAMEHVAGQSLREFLRQAAAGLGHGELEVRIVEVLGEHEWIEVCVRVSVPQRAPLVLGPAALQVPRVFHLAQLRDDAVAHQVAAASKVPLQQD